MRSIGFAVEFDPAADPGDAAIRLRRTSDGGKKWQTSLVKPLGVGTKLATLDWALFVPCSACSKNDTLAPASEARS
jgi:hypothetical protein